MMSFFQPSLPQVCTAFLELRRNGDQAISHVQRSLSCTDGNPSNLPLNREDDGPEMGVLNTSARAIVQQALAPCPIQSFSVLDGDELLQAFFSGKSDRTIESYRRDLQTFCEFLQVSGITEAVKILFSGTHREANLTALKYRQHLIETKRLKPKSVNRHLASLRSLVGLGQSLGMIPWKLSVKNQKVTELRNLAAPDPGGIKRLIKAAGIRGNKTSKRNVALCFLLYTAGLRRNEAISAHITRKMCRWRETS